MSRLIHDIERVLLVEDDVVLARSTRRAIEERDKTVVEVFHDFESARQAVVKGAYDAIVSDFDLPDGTGADVLSLALMHNPDAPRILVTAHTQWSTAARTINQASVFRVLGKPVGDEGLRDVVDQALELKRTRDERNELKEIADRQRRELAEANATLFAQNLTLDRTVKERVVHVLKALMSGHDFRVCGNRRRSFRVASIARALGKSVGLFGSELEALHIAALLHDVGAIALRDSVNERGSMRISDGDRRRVPELGHALLSDLPFLSDSAQIVRESRVRFDGRDAQKAGTQIHRGARLLAVALRYDELTCAAPLDLVAHLAACDMLSNIRDSELDPALVGLFIAQPFTAWKAIVDAAG